MLKMPPILPTRIGDTQWLPHYKRAIDAFLKGYRAFRLQLESSSHGNAKAEGLVKLARDGYGENAVSVLYGQLGSLLGDVDLDDLTVEWRLLKALLFQKYPGQLLKDLTWEAANKDLSDQGLDTILTLVDLICALPPTSVRNESTFSVMKLLKTKRRGRLSSKRLNDLMMVQLMLSNIEEFDPDKAIKQWMITPSGRRRRVGYTRESPISTNTETTTETVDLTVEAEPADLCEETSGILQGSTSKFDFHSDFDTDSGSDSADESEDDNEMAEETLFSMLFSFRE